MVGIEYYKKQLEAMGLKVTSHKPGRQRLYQVGYITSNGAFSPISPYMTAAELKAFYYGYIAGKGRPGMF